VHPEESRRLGLGFPARRHHRDDLGLLVGAERRAPPADTPLCPRGGEARLRALADHGPFKLRKVPHHLHQQAPSRRGGIDRFRQTAKAGLGRLDPFHNMEQVFERP
jgi:hypothetical protein